MSKTVRGSCLCGAVSYAAERISDIVECHCAMCRKAAGGHAGFFFVAMRNEVSWEGEGKLTHYESSPGLIRSFCSRCGTAMTGANLKEPDDTIILSANALEGDVPARVIAQEFCASKATWFAGHDEAPEFDGPYPGWETLKP
ncbi:GFA family protein [Parvibaculum sp.]|uniref:GFA family protein n=1 Tax=Parvibaculum sp. TaxID=2024848 RepID=UPI003299CB0E